MKTIIRIIIFIVINIFVLSCDTQKSKEFKHVENYFKKTHNFSINTSINKIIVVTEGNSCGSCDKIFAETVFKNFQNDESVFLVTAQGFIVDIQAFLALEKNCFFDWQINSKEYPEFTSSRIIYLNNNKIDSILIINSSTILEQLEYIKNNK